MRPLSAPSALCFLLFHRVFPRHSHRNFPDHGFVTHPNHPITIRIQRIEQLQTFQTQRLSPHNKSSCDDAHLNFKHNNHCADHVRHAMPRNEHICKIYIDTMRR